MNEYKKTCKQCKFFHNRESLLFGEHCSKCKIRKKGGRNYEKGRPFFEEYIKPQPKPKSKPYVLIYQDDHINNIFHLEFQNMKPDMQKLTKLITRALNYLKVNKLYE